MINEHLRSKEQMLRLISFIASIETYVKKRAKCRDFLRGRTS
uniref:Uncharacterized protein n=1 Tax=Rhizophora mucronata TaxID=61149 RepID=A0A2P2IUC0_RHIMU